MTVKERLEALRILMKEKGVDAYLVPTDDFHGSEYVGDYFKCRKYITGFTGSAGTAVIMKDSGRMADTLFRRQISLREVRSNCLNPGKREFRPSMNF